MEKYNNWKRKFYAIWAGQAVSLITSAILQMAIIFYLTEKTGSAMVLSMASLVGFLPYAWGFPDKTDSLELGFLTKSQFYSKSHNSSFFKPPFALNSFV